MSDRLPGHCSALGLRLVVQAGSTTPPDVPERLWREAELMERPTRVAVLPLAPDVHRLALGCFGDYTVDLSAHLVEVHRLPEQGARIDDVLEGPVLLHALATRGIHVLHASALRLPDGRVLAFTADSGTGKSSLAARAMQHGWIRVADDLLALRIADGRLQLLPGLRQPKLTPAEQPGTHLAETLPLDSLCQLQRVAGSAGRRTLDHGATFRLLLQSTVATRVYAPACLAAHLRFAAQAAESVRQGLLQAAILEMPERPADVATALDEVLALLQG